MAQQHLLSVNHSGDEMFEGNHQAGSHLPDGGQTRLLTLPYQAGKAVEETHWRGFHPQSPKTPRGTPPCCIFHLTFTLSGATVPGQSLLLFQSLKFNLCLNLPDNVVKSRKTCALAPLFPAGLWAFRRGPKWITRGSHSPQAR